MDSQRLAHALIAADVLSAADVEGALQRQVVLGGSLDTNLLESELVDEARLLTALSDVAALPVATRSDIDAIAAHIPRLFPKVFAETYHLVPMRLVNETLTVLCNGVPDPQLTERITERLHLSISPCITSEARLHYAMHRLYGTELLPRFTTLLARLDGTIPAPQAPDQPAQQMLSWGVSSARIAPAGGSSGKLRGQDVRTMVAQLNAATNRDTMVEILLGFALAVFEYAGLLLVQGRHVQGWRSTDAEATQRLAKISLPLNEPSIFHTTHAIAGHTLGPLPHNPINNQFLNHIGRAAPRTAFLAPMLVGGKLAAILYADNGAQGVSSKRVAALLVLVQRTALGLEGLIRKRKTEMAATSPAQPPAEKVQATATTEDDFSSVDVSVVAPVAPQAAAGPDLSAPIGKPATSKTRPIAPPVVDGFANLAIEVDMADDAAREDIIPAALVAAPSSLHADADDALYVAFADIDESPQESLDEWQDVMVDAVTEVTRGRKKADAATGADAPLSVTWNDVVAEARGAAHLTANLEAQVSASPQKSHSVQMLGSTVDERDIWFDALDSDDAEARHTAVTKLLPLGASVDNELAKRFPGRLNFAPLAPGTRPPPFAHCSGITQLLHARGADAAAVVLPQLEHDDPVRRFIAVYFLLTISYPPACEALARRLYDTEPRNRHLAVEALRRYKNEAVYTRIVHNLREQLKLSVPESQSSAIQILGQLREASVVPALIPLVNQGQPEIARTASAALAVICAQAFGADLSRWQLWWQGNYTKPRAVWLVSGLSHPSATIRRVANSELQHLSGQVVPFDAEAPEAVRSEAVHAWQTWLQGAQSQGSVPM